MWNKGIHKAVWNKGIHKAVWNKGIYKAVWNKGIHKIALPNLTQHNVINDLLINANMYTFLSKLSL